MDTDSTLPLDPFHPALIISFLTGKPNTLNFKEFNLNFKDGNYSEINNYFKSVDWYSIIPDCNINEATVHFYNVINEAINKYIPTRTYFFSKYKIWFSPELKNIIRNKKISAFKF